MTKLLFVNDKNFEWLYEKEGGGEEQFALIHLKPLH
jgi:hypothetical protein